MNFGNKILYAFLFAWVKVHAMQPMWMLYLMSDFLYLIVYRVVRYRLGVVRRNLAASFPDRDRRELRRLERAFYRHFTDYIVETIKLADISLEEVQRRAFIRNPELIDRLMDEGHPCVIFLMGHIGNWEWFSASTSRFEDARVYDIYRQLNNHAFDRLFLYLRTRFGGFVINKKDTVRDMIQLKRDQTRSIVVFLADQTPSRANLHYWTPFLHQDTPFLNGAERIARKLDIPVIYVETKVVRRGYYTVDLKLITDKPRETAENWITERYARMLEQSILQSPQYWLWSHKRWKYKHIES